MGDFRWDFTSKVGVTEIEMSHVCKTTKLRRNCGVIEIVVSKFESLEMAKREDATIGIDGIIKPTATKINANHMTCHFITRHPLLLIGFQIILSQILVIQNNNHT